MKSGLTVSCETGEHRQFMPQAAEFSAHKKQASLHCPAQMPMLGEANPPSAATGNRAQ
ncbi:hypothetical protein [Bradyrhizobium sp. Cp5.3]|uniref:hypothetical protein n=1 Tax=Bradyrhizobium sp. Cp5.3 TaxID=443598 RepID=UPI0012EC454C|nr:hypothetical protein [Bradyrhizobium sp. Cp5.3]